METQKIRFTPYNNRTKTFEGEFIETNDIKAGDWFLTHHTCKDQEVQIAQEVKETKQCLVVDGVPVYDLITMEGSAYKSNLKLMNADFTNVLYKEPIPLDYGKEETYFNVTHKVCPPKYLSEWLNNYDILIQIGFTMPEIEYALKCAGITLKDLTEEQAYENDFPKWKGHKISVINPSKPAYFTRYATVKGHTYERTERVNSAWAIRQTAQYQGGKHDKIMYHLLSNRFDWFKDFKWSLYQLDRVDGDIYMKVTPKKDNNHQTGSSLYVPILALINSDWSLINERVTKYFSDYYSTPDRAEYLKSALGTLETVEALKLKEYITPKS